MSIQKKKRNWWFWWVCGSGNSAKVLPNHKAKSLIEQKKRMRNVEGNSKLNGLIIRGEMNDEYYQSDSNIILPPLSDRNKGK